MGPSKEGLQTSLAGSSKASWNRPHPKGLGESIEVSQVEKDILSGGIHPVNGSCIPDNICFLTKALTKEADCMRNCGACKESILGMGRTFQSFHITPHSQPTYYPM